MIKLLLISGSPVENSSVDILLNKLAESFVGSFESGQVETELIRLNDFQIGTCQACGESPAPEFCFYDDGMTDIYDKLIDCDALVVGSPIYFDTVSAQTKLFIDRCNCMKPGDFSESSDGNSFVHLVTKKRQGAIVLVGGEQGYYEGARRVIAGFFKWIRVINHGEMTYASSDMRLKGTVKDNPEAINDAVILGKKLAGEILK